MCVMSSPKATRNTGERFSEVERLGTLLTCYVFEKMYHDGIQATSN